MYKFELGDTVRVFLDQNKGSSIPAGVCGKIVRRFMALSGIHCYTLTITGIRDEISCKESELKSTATRPTKQKQTSSTNPDFENAYQKQETTY